MLVVIPLKDNNILWKYLLIMRLPNGFLRVMNILYPLEVIQALMIFHTKKLRVQEGIFMIEIPTIAVLNVKRVLFVLIAEHGILRVQHTALIAGDIFNKAHRRPPNEVSFFSFYIDI